MTTSAESIRKYTGPPIFERGFRPFFLGAAIYAAIAIPVWLVILANGYTLGQVMPARELHMHEMVFGYISAVVAGFLLTATPNWTGRLPVTGAPLASLFLLWVAGRIVITLPSVPSTIAIPLESAFLVVLAAVMWREIFAARNFRNLPVCLLVSLIAGANVSFHLILQFGEDPDISVRFALGMVALLIMLIGGRIVPSFTRNWLAKTGKSALPSSFGGFDKFVLFSSAVAVGFWIVAPQAGVTGALALFAGVMQLTRLARWRGWTTLMEPLVAVLHIGYLWLPVWFLLLGASIAGSGWPEQSAALHALTAGAVGTMTIAVMSRAILGHSGRQLRAGPFTTLVYLMIVVGAILRVMVQLVPGDYFVVLSISGILWSGGFALFVAIYGPMCLMRQRAV